MTSHISTPHPCRNILLIVGEGGIALDISGPMEVFAIANGHCQLHNMPAPYKLIVASAQGGVIHTRTGLEIMTQALSSIHGEDVDTIIIAGRGADHETENRVIAWLQENWFHAQRICSICVGAFVLARAGILDGKAATTHWIALPEFASAFPQTKVQTDRVFVQDGNIWTSAGVLTGVDLALQLIENDLGRELSMRIAKILVSFIRRSADHAQHSDMLNMQSRADADFSALLRWVSENMRKNLRVDTLAAQANMSPRTFARRFKAATDMSPGEAIARIRTDAARQLLTDKQHAMKEVAALVGFQAEITLRRALRKYPSPAPRPSTLHTTMTDVAVNQETTPSHRTHCHDE